MENDNEKIEAIEACRTCGIFYMTTSNYLKPLFQSPVEQPEMMLIRLELAQWKVEVGENDGYPQYVCSTCIHEFHKLFKFRTSCVDTQEQFRHFYSIREENRANIKIKTELLDPAEDKPVCDFIYVDELSDNEYDGATPFNIPHVPIKEELIEAATIPMDDSVQSISIMESAARVVQIATQPPLAAQNDVTSTLSSVAVVQKPPEIECKLCLHLSFSPEEYTQHMQSAHDVSDMTCHICGKKFKDSTPARLKFHMKWHSLKKYVKCVQCGFVCNSKEALQEHKRSNHAKINCKICGKGVLAKKMKSHLREHVIISKYPCEYCTEAFPSENERESHIWQIHANDDDDNDDNNQIPTTSDHVNEEERTQNILDMPTEEEEEELLRDDPSEDTVDYKFFCAHCDGKFMQQIDLEKHVMQEHRSKPEFTTTTTTTEQEAVVTNHDRTINTIGNAINDDHTAIAVFEDYDNETHMHKAENESHEQPSLVGMSADLHIHSEIFTNLTERVENENDEAELTDQEIANEHLVEQKESQLEATYNSAQEASADSDTTSINSESEEDDTTDLYFPKHANDELHPFACAKCSQTFATIEQLRLHHEQHLATTAAQKEPPPTQQLETTPPNSKAKFKCHLCAKTFDLKFSLNRHVTKHKHAPF